MFLLVFVEFSPCTFNKMLQNCRFKFIVELARAFKAETETSCSPFMTAVLDTRSPFQLSLFLLQMNFLLEDHNVHGAMTVLTFKSF